MAEDLHGDNRAFISCVGTDISRCVAGRAVCLSVVGDCGRCAGIVGAWYPGSDGRNLDQLSHCARDAVALASTGHRAVLALFPVALVDGKRRCGTPRAAPIFANEPHVVSIPLAFAARAGAHLFCQRGEIFHTLC